MATICSWLSAILTNGLGVGIIVSEGGKRVEKRLVLREGGREVEVAEVGIFRVVVGLVCGLGGWLLRHGDCARRCTLPRILLRHGALMPPPSRYAVVSSLMLQHAL